MKNIFLRLLRRRASMRQEALSIGVHKSSFDYEAEARMKNEEPPNDAWVFLVVLLLSPFVYVYDLIKEWGKKR